MKCYFQICLLYIVIVNVGGRKYPLRKYDEKMREYDEKGKNFPEKYKEGFNDDALRQDSEENTEDTEDKEGDDDYDYDGDDDDDEDDDDSDVDDDDNYEDDDVGGMKGDEKKECKNEPGRWQWPRGCCGGFCDECDDGNNDNFV